MNKKGFTLVELMVVIVIIGVLAAVAIPKMMSATNKAKAGEGPQILRSIGNLQAAYKAENNTYVNCSNAQFASAGPVVANDGWGEIGFEQQPKSRTFDFIVTDGVPANSEHVYTTYSGSFTAKATLVSDLGGAKASDVLTLNQSDTRGVTGSGAAELRKLVPNWAPAAAAAGGTE